MAEKDVEVLLRGLAKAGSRQPPDEALEEVGGSNWADTRLERLGEWLTAETEGQPFYLVETIKVLSKRECSSCEAARTGRRS